MELQPPFVGFVILVIQNHNYEKIILNCNDIPHFRNELFKRSKII